MAKERAHSEAAHARPTQLEGSYITADGAVPCCRVHPLENSFDWWFNILVKEAHLIASDKARCYPR
jgi:hypothetical protein